MLIDTHCHLDDARFNGERKAMIDRARKADVKRFITIGCDVNNSIRAQGISTANADVYFSAGIHPHEAAKVQADDLTKLAKIAQDSKCVAIGECGLDYFYNHSPKQNQLEIFTEQIKLAYKIKKPIIIHVRDAFEDCISLLKKQKKGQIPIVIHCFTGSLADAKTLLNLGATLSISGVVTFAKPGDLIEVVKLVPLDKLLIETDSPYLAPIPHRGKRNEPAFIRFVAEKIAEIKQISLEDVMQQTSINAKTIFCLS